MTGYKLLRQLADGQLAPLFINKRQRIPVGVWLEAEAHPTKGFAFRPGWHATFKPVAPHLSTRGRVWCKCELENCQTYARPESQGGTWVLAGRMKILERMRKMAVKKPKTRRVVVTCPACNGDGEEPGAPVEVLGRWVCAQCKGSGAVTVQRTIKEAK